LNKSKVMGFRVATLNLERNEKRWDERRELILQQLGDLRPDMLSLNELWLPLQAGRWLQERAENKLGLPYRLMEQPRAAKASHPEAEGVLTRFPVVEQAHRFFSLGDTVTLVVRVEIDSRILDLYVTHLYPWRREEAERVAQVEELLAWIKERDDVDGKIVCGDCNATLEAESMKLMAEQFRPTQTAPTAFTPLREVDGEPSHSDWPRFDRCIDFIWISDSLRVRGSGLCFNEPAEHDSTLWPSDHIGVWADLEFV
jgi:endonuclease/exonuclease/phosphatase family metal-dependent hydrolase